MDKEEFKDYAVKRSTTTAGSLTGGIGGSLAGVAAGAAIGSVVPGIGTAIGGAVGGLWVESVVVLEALFLVELLGM